MEDLRARPCGSPGCRARSGVLTIERLTMTDSPLRILLMSAEMVPFAKTGGLADVTGALPKALKQLGHDVRAVLPRYSKIDRSRFGMTEEIASLIVLYRGRTARTSWPSCLSAF